MGIQFKKDYMIVKEDMKFVDFIVPNMIYNRFDLWTDCSNNVSLWHYVDNTTDLYFEFYTRESVGYLSFTLREVSKIVLKRITKHFFRLFSNIVSIQIDNCLTDYGFSYASDYYYIEFPLNIEEFDGRLSKKSKYNIQREWKLLVDNCGAHFVHVVADSKESDGIWNAYFDMKIITHGREYHMSSDEYRKKYHVTDLYALFDNCEKPIAVLLSCEQCEGVYLENLAYDINYSKFSPGKQLYHIYLHELINKHKKALYLLGGNLSYKKRYGSIYVHTFFCTVYRYQFLKQILHTMKNTLKLKMKS